ncbi:outer membrane protein [Shinella sedimenti]|uniref:Porin family protein n=1 Tax=Shinella sedimenti TaxID=2919913 RepID=A0ABT0CPT4_9HYPH|nr:outer membrane protein [Shinella sedimenti]MCJ8150596.1 porin family protein [Shinella sedimenti]
MVRRIASPVIAAFAGLLATSALAGDLDIINAPEIDVSQTTLAQGWYIRGDLGYSGWGSTDRPDYTAERAGGGTFSQPFDSARFSKPVSYGVGVGYQFSDFSRADLTTDFFSGDMSGDSAFSGGCAAGAPGGTNCRFDYKGDYSAVNVMANGYVDLGTVAGITPYVGIGAGATYVKWSDTSVLPVCLDGAGSCAGASNGAVGLKGEDSWRFTYALMAGASVDLTERVKLDFGYRFSDTAGGKAFSGRGLGTSVDAVNGRDDGFQKHEIRAGIRVNTW